MASNQKGFMPGAQGQYQGGQLPLGVTQGQLAGGYQPQGSRSNFTAPQGNQGPPRPLPGSPEKAALGGSALPPMAPPNMGPPRPLPGSPEKAAYGAAGGVGGAALSAPPLQGTQIPSSGPLMAPPAPPMAAAAPPPIGGVGGPLPAGEPGPIPAPAGPPPGGGMTGGPLTPNPVTGDKPGGFGYTGVNPYTQKPAQYGKVMPGAGGPGPLRPPGFQNT